MPNCENESVVLFDTLYTHNHIQILKVLLPYFDADSRKNLAVMIKFMELEYTMEYVNRHPPLLKAAAFEKDAGKKKQPDIVEIFEQIKLFCTPSERAMFDQLTNMKKSLDMYQEVMDMMQMLGPLTQPDSNASSSAGGINPLDLLKGMLSPEQQNMFEMFQSSLDSQNEK